VYIWINVHWVLCVAYGGQAPSNFQYGCASANRLSANWTVPDCVLSSTRSTHTRNTSVTEYPCGPRTSVTIVCFRVFDFVGDGGDTALPGAAISDIVCLWGSRGNRPVFKMYAQWRLPGGQAQTHRASALLVCRGSLTRCA
jgi:hypothetical protein